MLTTIARGVMCTSSDRRLSERSCTSISKQLRPISARNNARGNRPAGNENHSSRSVCFASDYTEVPLVFEMTKPVWTPLYTGAIEILITVVSAYITVKVLQFLTKRTNEDTWSNELAPDSRIKRNKTVGGAALKAITTPLSFILPIAAVLHCFRVFVCRLEQSLQLCSTCSKRAFERNLEVFLDLILRVLTPVDNVVAMVLKQGFLLASIWFLVTFKNQYVTWFLDQRAKRDPTLAQDMRRIIIPLNTFATWSIVAVGGIVAAAVAGLDIRPVLTFGGASSVVVGIGAQSVLSNMIAGINLFLSRPFVAGDRIQIFSTLGTLIYSGLVERVNPLRTIIRTDLNYPLTLPNKLLSEMVIGNESRFPVTTTTVIESGRRVAIILTFGIEYFEKLDEASEIIKELLENFPGLNHGLPYGVSVGTLTDSDLTLDIYGTALKRESSNFGELRVRLMRELKEKLNQLGIQQYKLSFAN